MTGGRENETDDDRALVALAEAAGLAPPGRLRPALLEEMRDLRQLALILRTLPLDRQESASVFRVSRR